MKRVLILIAFAAGSLQAQFVLQAGKEIQIPVPGVTAAVSLDTSLAEATVMQDAVLVKGISAGDTHIVAMTPTEIQDFRLHLEPSSPVYPPGFVSPWVSENEQGSLELRYASAQTAFESILDLYSRNNDRTVQIHATTATFESNGSPETFVPSAFYKIGTPNGSVTFLDEGVANSPLTLDGVVLRGLHVEDSGWRFHVGYTASAGFNDVFLPTDREFAAGTGYLWRLGSRIAVMPNFYFLHSINFATGLPASAAIESLRFNIALAARWRLQTEIGYGRGWAYASELNHTDARGNLKARIVDKDARYPSVRSGTLPGLLGELSATENLTTRLSFLLDGNVDNIHVKDVHQESSNAYTSIRYKMTHSWSVGTGVTWGSFANPGVYSDRTFSLPQQIAFDRPRFGAGFQYQFSGESHSFSSGRGIGQTLRLTLGHVELGEFVNLQNDALSVQALYSEIPGLQQELQQLGLLAVSPAQLENLLQNTAFLQSIGLSSQAQVVTVPKRLQAGGSLTWSSGGDHPHHLSLSFIESHNEFATSSYTDYNLSGLYNKQLGLANQLQASWSLERSTQFGRNQFTPLLSLSFRHTFSVLPGLLSAGRRVEITGTVFVDSRRRGIYEPDMQAIEGATVTLDGRRIAVTDLSGRYHFSNVPEGEHRLQLRYESGQPHFFTTPNEVSTMNDSVNFGVAFPTLELWGYVQDDAGNGLDHVALRIAGPKGTVSATSDSSGKFVVSDVRTGNYQVTVQPESLEAGFAADQLTPTIVTVDAGGSGTHPTIKIPVNRTLLGTVMIYDVTAGNYLPVKGAIISITAIHARIVTNATGQFLIGHLPAGEVQVTVTAGSATLTQTLSLSVASIVLRDDLRVSSVTGQISANVNAVPY